MNTKICQKSSKLQSKSSIPFALEKVTVMPANHRSTHSTVSIMPHLPLYRMDDTENLFVTTAILMVISKAAALPLRNKHQQSPCTLQNQSCKYGRAHKCTVCSNPGCKALVHDNVSPAVANACDFETPQGPTLSPAPEYMVFDAYSSNFFQRIIHQSESHFFLLSSHFSWQTSTAPTRLLLLSHTV